VFQAFYLNLECELHPWIPSNKDYKSDFITGKPTILGFEIASDCHKLGPQIYKTPKSSLELPYVSHIAHSVKMLRYNCSRATLTGIHTGTPQ